MERLGSMALVLLATSVLGSCSERNRSFDNSEPTAKLPEHSAGTRGVQSSFARLKIRAKSEAPSFLRMGSQLMSKDGNRTVTVDESGVQLVHGTTVVPELSAADLLIDHHPVPSRGEYAQSDEGSAWRELAPGLRELVSPTAGGFRWSWEIDKAPGEVELEFALKIPLTSVQDLGNEGLTFRAGTQAFTVSHALWIGADQITTEVKGIYHAGRLVFRVPASVVAHTKADSWRDVTCI